MMLPETFPYVARIIRIFGERPCDDSSATVLRDYARATLATRPEAAEGQGPVAGAVKAAPTHRHKKRGSEYVLLGIGKMQAEDWYVEGDFQGETNGYDMQPADMREVAIYRSVDDGSWWARPREEFEDGRFEKIASPVHAPEGAALASADGGRELRGAVEAAISAGSFGYDPATGFTHADDGGAPNTCVFFDRREAPALASAGEVDRLTRELAEMKTSRDRSLDKAIENARKLDAALRSKTPEGMVLVPREPTEAMHDAARDWSVKKYGLGIGTDASDGCYRAMIAAAPTPDERPAAPAEREPDWWEYKLFDNKGNVVEARVTPERDSKPWNASVPSTWTIIERPLFAGPAARKA